ncbi:molecular chaperone DnaJ [Tardibacter chloracetimidivorans]|uniref:Molecular chaperone DnaJ n=1 Tax=Tardibacter chloracetimidivorans TaxID=1921510 RepID=A0A1L4A013_9SPHN|nr:J domain-containing protein [Tardibacter chloracetimidivorans]API61228.1 molecular chaperone DnaJ [Tardibacter chloracetimidivorans]
MGEGERQGSASARRPGRFHGRVAADGRGCEHPGCEEAGEFRAPRDRAAQGAGPPADRWRWFCLDHVRAFNAGYNYFKGMTPDEIEAAQRPLAGWERETRVFAANGDPEPAWSRFTDPADILSARFARSAVEQPVSRNGQVLSGEDRKALKVLGLDACASLHDIRRAYAERVRRYHPDKNGGDRTHERALQAVISAYTHLRKAPAFS